MSTRTAEIEQSQAVVDTTHSHSGEEPTGSAGPSTSANAAAMTGNYAAKPIRVQYLEKMLDITKFLEQLEQLLSQPIKIPGTSLLPYPGSSNRVRHSMFSVKGIWASDEARRADTARLYNMRSLKKRKWLRSLLLEESDSDSDGEFAFTQADLHILLKIHRRRRKLQKNYHSDILNSQYTYYGAGLLAQHDPFPEHQAFVQEQYGFQQ